LLSTAKPRLQQLPSHQLRDISDVRRIADMHTHYTIVDLAGSAKSYVDLNPSGFDGSSVEGISGTQQVGEGLCEVFGEVNGYLIDPALMVIQEFLRGVAGEKFCFLGL